MPDSVFWLLLILMHVTVGVYSGDQSIYYHRSPAHHRTHTLFTHTLTHLHSVQYNWTAEVVHTCRDAGLSWDRTHDSSCDTRAQTRASNPDCKVNIGHFWSLLPFITPSWIVLNQFVSDLTTFSAQNGTILLRWCINLSHFLPVSEGGLFSHCCFLLHPQVHCDGVASHG